MSLQSQLLKEGTRHLAGVDEAVLKNIDAVREMSKIARTSLGPQGAFIFRLISTFSVKFHHWQLFKD